MRAPLLLLAICLCASIAACDAGGDLTGSASDRAFAPAAGAAALQGSGLASSASLSDDGISGVSIPSLSYSTSGTLSAPSGGYGSVSNFGLSSSLSSGSDAFPQTLSSTPTSVRSTTNGVQQTFQLDAGLQSGWQTLSDETERGPAPATAAGGQFRDLSLADRLDQLRERGYRVEAMGRGKYRLRVAGGPSGLVDGAGRSSAQAVPQNAEFVAVYDASTNSVESVDIYVDDQLKSASSLSASGTLSSTATIGLDPSGAREVQFSNALGQ